MWANASVINESASDNIGRVVSVPIISVGSHVSMPALISIIGAELTTRNPDGSGITARPGMIYLWLDARSCPRQYPMGSAKEGDSFSNMAPLPAAAIHFIAASGQRYEATRANPVSQSDNPNSDSDNGLLDATYYYTVPFSTRRGDVVISGTSMLATQYTNFEGLSHVLVRIGGPISFRVSFPKKLTVTTTSTVPPRPTPGVIGANFLNDVGEFFTLILIAYITVKVRRRRRIPQPVGHTTAGQRQPPPAVAINTSERTPKPHIDATNGAVLRVDVMGPLRIDPIRGHATDPLKALVAYLALHDDRPQNADEIQTALWPDDGSRNGVTQKTFLNYVSRARQFIGVEHLPEAQNGSGYALTNAVCDWREFRTLAATADRSSATEAVILRRKALRIIRGVPFQGDTTTYFEWPVTQKYVTSMIEGVTKVADTLQRDLVVAGDLDGAEWAVRRAMKLAPTELPLWRALVDICDARNDDNVMARFWAEAEHDLWPKAVEELRARLVG